MKKHIALVLGLLLLVAPSAFAQYGEGGTGAGTFTVPTLTVNGTLTAGSFVTTGAVLIPDGAVGTPGLAFSDETSTGLFQEAAGELNLASLGVEVVEIRSNGNFYMLNPANTTGSFLGFETQFSANNNNLYGHTPGEVNPTFVLFINDSTGINMQLDDSNANIVTLVDGSGAGTTTNAFRFTNQAGTQYISLEPSGVPSGTNVITVPDLAGTLLVGGATNTLGAVTTTINSGTAFNIHSDLAVTIDGDADNNNTGAITLTNDNDTQQVLLTTTGISYISDSSFAGQVDDGAGNVASASHTPTAVTLASVTDGTDTAEVRVASANSINLDADNDADGDGTILLIADNGQSGIQIDNTGIDAVSEGPFTVEIDDGATEIGWMSVDDAAIVLDADYDDGGGGTIDFVVDNSQTALRLATNTTTVSVSDGTDTADIRMGQTSVTIDADVDDDIDGVITLQSNNELVKLELDALGAGGLRGTTTGAGGQITMNSANTIYLAGDSDTDNSGDATLTGDTVYILGDQAADGTGDIILSNNSGNVALTISGGGGIDLFATDGPVTIGTQAGAVPATAGGNGYAAQTWTEGAATTMLSWATSAGDYGGGTWNYSAFAEDATDHQVRTASAFFSYSNKGGTLICSATVDSAEDVVVSAGTLTCTPSCNVSGTTVQLQLNCTSSLTQTSSVANNSVHFHHYSAITEPIVSK